MNWKTGRSIPCEPRQALWGSRLRAERGRWVPAGSVPSAPRGAGSSRCPSDERFRISRECWQMASLKPSWTPDECFHPKELGKPGVSRGICSAASLRAPALRAVGAGARSAVRKRSAPRPPPLHSEEMAVFVAVFGEPQGVVDCNKQSRCHGSQTWTGCVSWKEKTYGDF